MCDLFSDQDCYNFFKAAGPSRLLKNSCPGDMLKNRGIFHGLSSSWWPPVEPGIGLLDERALSRTFFSSLLGPTKRDALSWR
ncbi:MAG: hypothetical protein ACOCYW_05320 [Roseicyclus sp.]